MARAPARTGPLTIAERSGHGDRGCADLGAGLAPENEELGVCVDRDVDQGGSSGSIALRFSHGIRELVAAADRDYAQNVYLAIASLDRPQDGVATRSQRNGRRRDTAGSASATNCEDGENKYQSEECGSSNSSNSCDQ
jgi:hypothetical protein